MVRCPKVQKRPVKEGWIEPFAFCDSPKDLNSPPCGRGKMRKVWRVGSPERDFGEITTQAEYAKV